MNYHAHLARHLEPDEHPDHDPDECATHPCDDCWEIERDQAAEAAADAWRDERP